MVDLEISFPIIKKIYMFGRKIIIWFSPKDYHYANFMNRITRTKLSCFPLPLLHATEVWDRIANILDCLPGCRLCSKQHTCSLSLNPLNAIRCRGTVPLFPFYLLGNWGTGRLINVLIITQLTNGKVRIQN